MNYMMDGPFIVITAENSIKTVSLKRLPEIGVGENITVSISVTNGNGYITDVYESANYYSSFLDA